MNISFHNPKVQEWVISYTRDKLVDLQQRNKEISAVHVSFRQQDGPGCDNNVCEIELTIYGDSLFVHCKAAVMNRQQGMRCSSLPGKLMNGSANNSEACTGA